MWQLIETAPMDGSLVLLYMPGGICIAPSKPAAELSSEQKVQLAAKGVWPDYEKWTATHWMPLPAPPKL